MKLPQSVIDKMKERGDGPPSTEGGSARARLEDSRGRRGLHESSTRRPQRPGISSQTPTVDTEEPQDAAPHRRADAKRGEDES